MKLYIKPPVGIIPRKLHDEKRVLEIVEAIQRYVKVGMPVSKEWTKELAYLCNRK